MTVERRLVEAAGKFAGRQCADGHRVRQASQCPSVAGCHSTG